VIIDGTNMETGRINKMSENNDKIHVEFTGQGCIIPNEQLDQKVRQIEAMIAEFLNKTPYEISLQGNAECWVGLFNVNENVINDTIEVVEVEIRDQKNKRLRNWKHFVETLGKVYRDSGIKSNHEAQRRAKTVPVEYDEETGKAIMIAGLPVPPVRRIGKRLSPEFKQFIYDVARTGYERGRIETHLRRLEKISPSIFLKYAYPKRTQAEIDAAIKEWTEPKKKRAWDVTDS
jgi:hypothetical protein